MTVTLFQLVKEEKGILIPSYDLWNYTEFKEKIKEPLVKFMIYEKAIVKDNFVKDKMIEYFDDLLKQGIDFMEINLHTKMWQMQENFKENVRNSRVDSICPQEALKLIEEVRDLPQHKYILLNIDKINIDLMSIYHKY